MKSVKIVLWGTTIGYLGYEDGSKIAIFEYDNNFIKSGINISPIKMKYPPLKHTFPESSFNTFKGVPGVFADSLPDKFGNQLIDQFMAEKNIFSEDVTTLDRLMYVGNRSMGAIEYHPFELDEDLDNNIALDIHTLSELAELVLSKKTDFSNKLHNANTKKDALTLIRVGSSAGGARSKALVVKKADGKLYDGTKLYDEDCSYWLLKFDSADNSDRDHLDPKGMTRIEFIYSIIARKCGIDMPKTDFIENGADFHFMIERFDRINQNKKSSKLHYISWAGLSHYDRDTTGAYSYEQLILAIRDMQLGQKAVTEVFRRAVFNIVGRNQDDHTKNFGFIMNKKGEWSLSAAFDMTYSYDATGKWTKVHQIKLNRKQDDFILSDIVEFGKYCNLSEKKSTEILKNTISEFLKFEKLAKEYRVDNELRVSVGNKLRIDILENI